MNKLENFEMISGVSITEESIKKYGELDKAMSLVESFIDSNFIGLDHSSVTGLHDLTIRPASYVLAAVTSIIREFGNQRSIEAVKNGTHISEGIVDSILSNFFIDRKAGSRATGWIKITIEETSSSIRISGSMPFTTSSGLEFFTNEDIYISQSSGKIIPLPGGIGYFLLKVTARDNGSKYNIPKSTQLVYSSSISNLISCVSESQFSGGEDNEKNEDIIRRLKSSISARGMFSSESIKSSILDKVDWVDDVFTCGSSSGIVYRNFFGNLGAKLGGFCDVYVSSGSGLDSREVSLLATRRRDGEFLVDVPAEAFPGHYDVISIKNLGLKDMVGGYSIISKRRHIDSNLKTYNRVINPRDCIYSRYMATEVIFDTGTEIPTEVTELMVSALVLTQGDISSVQSVLSSEESGVVMVDALAKSMVPCFVHFDKLTMVKSSGAYVSRTDILSSIESYIMSCNSVTGIKVTDMISNLMKIEGIAGVELPIVLCGEVLLPLEVPRFITISSMNRLTVEEDIANGIWPGMVRFLPNTDKLRVEIRED